MTIAASVHLDAVRSTFAAARNVWTGCDWPTEFGPLRLPLTGLKSTHARLLARATAGDEADAWHRAADWLDRVESDAQAAQNHARQSVEAAERGQWNEALRLATRACELEGLYRHATVWEPLRALLQDHVSVSSRGRATERHN